MGNIEKHFLKLQVLLEQSIKLQCQIIAKQDRLEFENVHIAVMEEINKEIFEVIGKFPDKKNDLTKKQKIILADKEFREYARLVLKNMQGDFESWSKEMIETVGEKIKENLPQLYKNLIKEQRIISYQEERSKLVFEVYKATVNLATECIAEGMDNINDFAKQCEGDITKIVHDAWDEATEAIQPKTVEDFENEEIEPLIIRSLTAFDAVWDSSLIVVAKSLRTEHGLANAVEAGLKFIRQTDWYKKLSEKQDFEDKYKAHFEKELQALEMTETEVQLAEIYKLEYWTKRGMEIIKKEGINKPDAVKKIIQMENFKQSGISHADLSKSIDEIFEKDIRQVINDMKKALDQLEYWTNIGLEIIKKEGINKPNAVKKIIEMENFKQSGISETQLLDSISEVFRKQRKELYEEAKRRIAKIRKAKEW